MAGQFVFAFFPCGDAKDPTDAKGSERAKCVNHLIRNCKAETHQSKDNRVQNAIKDNRLR